MRVTEQRNKHTTTIGWKVHKLGAIPKCKYIVPFRLGYPLLWTSTSHQSSRGVHNFGHESPYINISHQLGREVHDFGQKFLYTNISSQWRWGVHNFGRKSRYTNISSQLGWGNILIITLLTFQLWFFKVNYKFKVYLQIKISIKDDKSYFKNSLSSLLKRPISFNSQSSIGKEFHSRMPR